MYVEEFKGALFNLGQKYVLHNNYSGQKQRGNFISLPFKISLNSFCAL